MNDNKYTIDATEGGICQTLWTGRCTLREAQAELVKIGGGLRYSDYVDADDDCTTAIETLILSAGDDYEEILVVEMQAA